MENSNNSKNLNLANDPLSKLKKANDDFVMKTEAIIKDINSGLGDLKKQGEEIKAIDRAGADEMDAAILKFVS